MTHEHLFSKFVERGCTDDKVFAVCSCGYYEEVK